jgi:hypothetical protein
VKRHSSSRPVGTPKASGSADRTRSGRTSAGLRGVEGVTPTATDPSMIPPVSLSASFSVASADSIADGVASEGQC